MSTRKTTLFYALLLMTASLFVGMVIASRLDLAPPSSAQTIAVPAMNSAPITGPLDAQTFRNVAKLATPMVVNIRTEMKAKATCGVECIASTMPVTICTASMKLKMPPNVHQ